MRQSLYSRFANAALFPVLDGVRGIPISKHLHFLEESQWWSRQEIEVYQNEQLARLIQHVYANVPYYRRVMDELDLRPANVATRADLAKLPILTKETVRQNFEALIATNVDRSKLVSSITGGSTGEPMQFYRDQYVLALNQAAFWRGLAWAGLHRGERILMLTGGSMGTAPESRMECIKAFFARQYSYPAFEINQSTLNQVVSLLHRIQPKAIKGYVSTLVILAELIEKAGIKVHVPIVFTTAEKLWPEQAEQLGAVFGGNVIDYYGCGEINSIAFQEKQGGALYVSDEKVILETAPLMEDSTSHTGKQLAERFLLTDLTNYVFPFIRYENGDAGLITNTPDSSGRGLSRIQSLDGRIHDTITTTSGEPLAGEFFPHLFRFVDGVDYFQIVQDEIDHLTINIVTNARFRGAQETFLRQKMQEYAGRDMRIDFNQVNEIPRTRAGKLRVTVSLLN